MPSTSREQISPKNFPSDVVARAAQHLRDGKLVAFPTETVYGLGADAHNPFAVRRVFEAKGRPSDNPLIVHVATPAQISEVAREIPESARTLADCYWPGPLTLVLKRNKNVPDIVTAYLDTVAVRVPRHQVALALITELGRGIVGPSANLSGRPSPTEAQHVFDDLAGRIEMILDSGPTEIGVESTVLDVTQSPPLILRRGGLSRENIEAVVGRVEIATSARDLARSPGTRHRHYAPQAKLIVVPEHDSKEFERCVRDARNDSLRVGAIIHSPEIDPTQAEWSFKVGDSSGETLARLLFRALRDLDREGLDLIVVEAINESGIGAAVMDRLRRAAAPS